MRGYISTFFRNKMVACYLQNYIINSMRNASMVHDAYFIRYKLFFRLCIFRFFYYSAFMLRVTAGGPKVPGDN